MRLESSVRILPDRPNLTFIFSELRSEERRADAASADTRRAKTIRNASHALEPRHRRLCRRRRRRRRGLRRLRLQRAAEVDDLVAAAAEAREHRDERERQRA